MPHTAVAAVAAAAAAATALVLLVAGLSAVPVRAVWQTRPAGRTLEWFADLDAHARRLSEDPLLVACDGRDRSSLVVRVGDCL